jgi:hypothetical protein
MKFSVRLLSSETIASIHQRLGLHIFPNFFNEDTHNLVFHELNRHVSKRRYELDHWDSVITNYRESEVSISTLSSEVQSLIQNSQDRFPQQTFSYKSFSFRNGPPMDHAHILDLRNDGEIRHHVDAIKFSGGIVAGLCFNTDALCTLKRDLSAINHYVSSLQQDEIDANIKDDVDSTELPESLEFELPKRCLYILSGASRYLYGHSIHLLEPKNRRISLMMRDSNINIHENESLLRSMRVTS